MSVIHLLGGENGSQHSLSAMRAPAFGARLPALDRHDPPPGNRRHPSFSSRPGRPDIANLTSKQRAFLRSRAHSLKPILQVGNEGVTEPLLGSIEEAFNTRELMKVKVLQGSPDEPREAARLIDEAIPAVQVVQTIGRTIVLYRPFPEEPEIRLPG